MLQCPGWTHVYGAPNAPFPPRNHARPSRVCGDDTGTLHPECDQRGLVCAVRLSPAMTLCPGAPVTQGRLILSSHQFPSSLRLVVGP